MLPPSKSYFLAALLCAGVVHAQTEIAPAAEPSKGQVLFKSHGEPPPPDNDRKVLTPTVTPVEVEDRERAAWTFTAYDFDARITPASAKLAMRARMTLRNDGTEPFSRIPLEVSSTLAWESFTLAGEPLRFVEHVIATDADHSGSATEAVVALPRALASGASLTLDAFYSGTITQSAERLKRIGATDPQADASDWDAIMPEQTLLRGFGNVLWYPVASPQLFLGDAANLVQAIGRAKLRESIATAKLRLAVEYRGEPPVTAFFGGRTKDFAATSDNAEVLGGIAIAEFPAASIGSRTLDLMILPKAETAIVEGLGKADDSSTSLSVVTADPASAKQLADAAQPMDTLLADWLGARPATALTVIDHIGQPYEDGPVLVAPVQALLAPTSAGALMHSLTHAWIQTGQPWMDEGLAQFFSLVWTEHEKGRPAMVEQLADLVQPLAVVEPGISSAAEIGKASPGQPLIAASDETFYRRKAAAVWMMLRDLAGEDALKFALQSLRSQTNSNTPREQAVALEKLLEKTSGKDLGWFFNDWVLRDLGLPDLSIVDVTPRNLPAGAGHDSGWLVAVTVHNDGAATADVPLVIRSGSYSTTKRIRVAGFSNATARVLVEAAPTEVVLNDGITPEIRAAVHTRSVNIHTQ